MIRRSYRIAFFETNRTKQHLTDMKNILKLEQVAIFLFSIILFNQTSFTWWLFPALILLPDISMIGYVWGTKFGAFLYNFFHHLGVAILFLTIGWWWHQPLIELTGIILLGHLSMDRIFGYGLKYSDSFQSTHLGKIGKN